MLKFAGAFRDNEGFMRDTRIGQGLFIAYRSHQALIDSIKILNPDSIGIPGIEASLVMTTYRPREMTNWESDLESSSNSVLLAVRRSAHVPGAELERERAEDDGSPSADEPPDRCR